MVVTHLFAKKFHMFLDKMMTFWIVDIRWHIYWIVVLTHIQIIYNNIRQENNIRQVNNIRQEKESFTDLHSVTVNQVIYAVDRLKARKADICDYLLSDNAKNDTNMLLVYISLLFFSMLRQGDILVYCYLHWFPYPYPYRKTGGERKMTLFEQPTWKCI